MSFSRLGIFLLLLPSAFAVSQAQTGNTASRNGLEVFGGYSYLLSNPRFGATSDLPSGSGFNVGVDGHIHRPFSLVGEISVFPLNCNCAYYSTPMETTFLFGPRYSFPVPDSSKLRPFVGLLIGGSTYSNTSNRYGEAYRNNSSFAYEINGGLDYRLTPRFALRGAVGYVHSTLTPYDPQFTSSGYGRAQFDVDLVYRF